MSYYEMGLSTEEAKFLETYPRLFPIATSFDIGKDYLDDIFSKMDESIWISTQTNHDSKQTHLHMMFIRLGHFKKSLDLREYGDLNLQQISELFGKYNTRFAAELLQVI